LILPIFAPFADPSMFCCICSELLSSLLCLVLGGGTWQSSSLSCLVLGRGIWQQQHNICRMLRTPAPRNSPEEICLKKSCFVPHNSLT
jgi:hypothetical protein